jgi:hypothetical protein
MAPHVLNAMEYHCDEYKCIVEQTPCPHCGAEDHQEVDF